MSLEPPSKPSAEQAEGVLRERLAGRVWDLRVLIREEGVILQGYAPNYYGKQLAQHAAMQVLGLRIWANEIEVRRALAAPDTDAE
jgi:hypothetical protein